MIIHNDKKTDIYEDVITDPYSLHVIHSLRVELLFKEAELRDTRRRFEEVQTTVKLWLWVIGLTFFLGMIVIYLTG